MLTLKHLVCRISFSIVEVFQLLSFLRQIGIAEIQLPFSKGKLLSFLVQDYLCYY